jgi:hypothetical protein
MKTYGARGLIIWILTLASGSGDIRKKGTGPTTHRTSTSFGQRDSFEAIEERKYSPLSRIIPLFLSKQSFTLLMI